MGSHVSEAKMNDQIDVAGAADKMMQDTTTTIDDVIRQYGADFTAQTLRVMADLIESGRIKPHRIN